MDRAYEENTPAKVSPHEDINSTKEVPDSILATFCQKNSCRRKYIRADPQF